MQNGCKSVNYMLLYNYLPPLIVSKIITFVQTTVIVIQQEKLARRKIN